jgi:hypothetical protein
MKKIRSLTPKPLVKQKPSKPTRTGLSKDDPEFFHKLGKLSAQKRALPPEEFSSMAARSHQPDSKRNR